MQITFLGSNLKKQHFLWAGSWVGVLSVVSRSSLGGIRQGIKGGNEAAILIKVLFWGWEFFRSSLVVPWFFLGFSLVINTGVPRTTWEKIILTESTFTNTHTMGRSYLPCTVLPCSHTAAWPQGSRRSMCRAISSEWGTLRAQHSECVPSHSFTLVFYPR